MSRASAAGFADFFPAAPRAAKNKAKERQRAKSKTLDSPSLPPVNTDQDATSTPKSRDDDAQAALSSGANDDVVQDTTILTAEDNEFQQGDLLNGVGSASSHTSTVSSLFSAPGQHQTITTFGGAGNINNLTPLTNIDSSPVGRSSSPQRPQDIATKALSNNQDAEKPIAVWRIPPPSPPAIPPVPRLHARDPSKGVKGERCTFDPLLDHKLSSSERKKATATYKDFGLVCTHNWAGASSFL